MLDPVQEPHLLVLGDSGSGKSGVLRTLAREIMRTRTAAEAQILLVDYRRALLGEVAVDFLRPVTSAAQAVPTLREIATYLEGRIPGPDVTPEQLRERSWWSGAELFVLVDDYDLVATQQGSPVAVPAAAPGPGRRRRPAPGRGAPLPVAPPARSTNRSSSRSGTSRCRA